MSCAIYLERGHLSQIFFLPKYVLLSFLFQCSYFHEFQKVSVTKYLSTLGLLFNFTRCVTLEAHYLFYETKNIILIHFTDLLWKSNKIFVKVHYEGKELVFANEYHY